jgi:hypothetical protein
MIVHPEKVSSINQADDRIAQATTGLRAVNN